ncbi:MAG: PIG-L family deacetylase [Acidobacteriaceae bacterium]|nr:PIG-L family deacetylase [Acidobacteriaceae bacterium]
MKAKTNLALRSGFLFAALLIAGAAISANNDTVPVDVNRGAADLSRWLAAIRTRASILMIVAHPDDEDGGMLAYQTRGLGARAVLMTLNRGEGGQNVMSQDLYDALGLVRTQELLASDRYYGVDQYWGRVIDYGFSKTREEALEQWGHDRVLSDVVRVVRMTRPLIITSVFAGAPTDGHGNHQVAGQMAQEVFLAAGDPNRFPEQIREGLRPWTPLKVYARVPFFETTKEGIYDYATDKYVPVRFFDYVNQTWINAKPAANVEILEGTRDAAAGLTFLQIGREGWGHQKSQNGGGTIPTPAPYKAPYHRYGSHVRVGEKESSFYDGIDVSLKGIAALAKGESPFLKEGLEHISNLSGDACTRYRADDPAAIAPILAEGLKATRSLLERVRQSDLQEPGKGDVAFELGVKEHQFQEALLEALGITFEAIIAPEKEPTGPFARFAGPQVTFRIAIPGQSFGVHAHLFNQGPGSLNIESIDVRASDGHDWKIRPDSSPSPTLAAGTDLRLKFAITAPADAQLTKPYFRRPDQEQPYYDLTDGRYRNLSFAPYPLEAIARITYQGTGLEIRQVVQSVQRIEHVGLQTEPLLMGPAISVSVTPAAGAVPLTARSFSFSCILHSNVKGHVDGRLRLSLPPKWMAIPAEHPFSLDSDETQTLTFDVTPRSIEPKNYDIRAIAEYKGKQYEEGYRLVGYPGLIPYPYYRPATYKAVGVDVKTPSGLRIGFVPGTGDDVPRALEDLGLNMKILSADDVEDANLKDYDAIVLGVRAYAVNSELRTANARLLDYVKNGGVLLVQYNLQNFEQGYGPYPFSLGQNPQKVVDERSAVKIVDVSNPILKWPNQITESDFLGWEEERGHGFMETWDPRYKALVETHDPGQDPQRGGLLVARYGKGIYIYDAFALYRQLPSGVPGAFRILANLVSAGKNPEWK